VIVPLQEQTGAKAYELVKAYAKSHGLHVSDSLVAATAIEVLSTKNRKHFAMIDGLSLEVP